jgi:hypothetical protein
MNSIFTIAPYFADGTWMFDDPVRDILKEPFVAGADDIIGLMSQGIPDAKKGFCLFFSDKQFPTYQHHFVWESAQDDGNWYYSAEYELSGWLCPALLKYFKTPPTDLFVEAKGGTNVVIPYL